MIVPTFLGILANIFPHSPRWLALVDRPQDALTDLARLRRLPRTDQHVKTEMRGILIEAEFQRRMQHMRHPGVTGFRKELLSWTDLFSKKTWRRLCVGLGIMSFQQLLGINVFIYYAPTLFESIGQSPETALLLSGMLNVLQLVAVCVCFTIIDRVGRRPLAIYGALACGIAWTVIAALVGRYSDHWPNHAAAGWAVVAMAFFFVLAFGVSYSPLGWTLPSEVFPSSMRAKGVALSTATCFLFNFMVGVATPILLEKIGFWTYVVFAACCFAATVWAYYLVRETKGRSLEQMDEVFGDNMGDTERQVMHACTVSIDNMGQL